MRIAVVEHGLRPASSDMGRELGEAAAYAVRAGAETVFLPAVLDGEGAEALAAFRQAIEAARGTIVAALVGVDTPARAFPTSSEVPLADRLGSVALLVGDACVDEGELQALATSRPAVLVMNPRSESELQAEAFLELAVGLSESVAGLVIVAEAVGAPAGEPGHGGSAIVLLGEVVAEAVGPEGDVLFADVPEPVPLPAARTAVPELPTILMQRRANHQGRKLEVDYPADLS